MKEIKNTNLIPPSPEIDIQNLKPFTRFCCSIGAIPASYLVSMSYEEQLLWLCDFLENTVIPTVNNNGEAVAELQSLFIQLKDYVDNYFKNLDVQNEINNKLDEMANDGTLYNIINNTLFNNINQNIENLTQQLQNTNTNLSSITSLANQNSNKIISIEEQIPSIISGNPKGTYENLEALQEAYPNGTTGIFVTTNNGHWYYYKSSSGWTDGGVYQSADFANGSVSPSKLNSFLNNAIQNTYIYPATNTIKKLNFDNTSKSYFVTFDNTYIMIAQQNMENYTNIKILGQTDFEIPNNNALVINKANLWDSALNYTPELVNINDINLTDFLNNYIILLYNSYGNLQGCMAYNFPFDNNKLSNKKYQISNKVLSVFNKQINNQWIGTSISHLTDNNSNLDVINFAGSSICDYDDLRNIMTPQYQKLLIFTGEWTAVFKENSSVDFVGGGHGNETLTELSLFVDGVKQNFDTDISLHNFDNIQILAKSNVYSRVNNNILCEKIILINISDDIEIKSKIIWKQNTNIYFNYINMLPVSRRQYANDSNPFVTNSGFNDIDFTLKNYSTNTFPVEFIQNASYFELFNNSQGFQFRTSIAVQNDNKINGNYAYVNPGSTNKIYFNHTPENYEVSENEVHSSTAVVKQFYSGLTESVIDL